MFTFRSYTFIIASTLFLQYIACQDPVSYHNGNFLVSPNAKLQVRFSNVASSLIESKLVNSDIQCSMLCQRTKLCRSINVEKDDGNGGMRRCEILSINKKQRGDLFTSNSSFDHMEINVSKTSNRFVSQNITQVFAAKKAAKSHEKIAEIRAQQLMPFYVALLVVFIHFFFHSL